MTIDTKAADFRQLLTFCSKVDETGSPLEGILRRYEVEETYTPFDVVTLFERAEQATVEAANPDIKQRWADVKLDLEPIVRDMLQSDYFTSWRDK